MPSIRAKIEGNVRVRPEHPALIDEHHRLSYTQLHTVTDRLAATFRQSGIGPERVVAVDVTRKLEAAVALIAALKAGGVYLPLQSGAPRDWKSFVVADSGADLIFRGTGVEAFPSQVNRLDWRWPDDMPGTTTGAENAENAADTVDSQAACVVYTSGTTGRPKGVCLTAGPLSEHLDAIIAGFGLRQEDRCLQFSPVNADTAIEQVLSVLALGATVVFCDETMSVAQMLRLFEREQVTVAHLSTGYWHIIANSLEWRQWPVLALRKVMVGGDRMSPRAVQLWQEKTAVPVVNAYGPTETVITPNVHNVTAIDPDLGVPIGDVVGQRSLHVLDEALQPVPAGQTGELFLGGLVARGYVGRPGLTAAAFLPDPFSTKPGARLYRTGDLVRRGRDGNLYFIGRADNQTKIRGLRVELAEVDAVLAHHPRVRECAVVAREDRPGDRRLVAYVVAGHEDLTEAELSAHLRSKLPDHMVPSIYCFMPELPLTANSKIDRNALRGERYQPSKALR
ncbi:MAG TPA: amino acid adenylation domain-containing protein [Candidatus Limnocylindrales bacterium]|nr:amino acid adenylation domain-containing protein [Candidatus Limnocylindrales bacterium]